MTTTTPAEPSAAEQFATAWNQMYRYGQPVMLIGDKGERIRTRTSGAAWVELGRAVIKVDKRKRPCLLMRVWPREATT